MADLLIQQPQHDGEKDGEHLVVKLLQLLSKGGITILDDHKEIIHHHKLFTKVNPDGSAEATDDCQDKSSLSISGTYQNKKVDILSIAAAYVNERTIFDNTPLHLSAETGDIELVNMFLQVGANVDAEDTDKRTPLHWSAMEGHGGIVKILLKAGANVNAEDIDKRTPLHLSATKGNEEIVKILLEAGANVDAKVYGKTLLYLSVVRSNEGIVKILLQAGASVDAEDKYKRTPLHLSAMESNEDIIKILLQAGASVDAEDKYKRTPLHKSATKGNVEIVQIFIKAGANVNAEDIDKRTPLHLSAMESNEEIIKILVKAGANVNAEDEYGNTPLHLSVLNDNEEIVQILLKAGANVDAESKNKQTPLHLSVQLHHDNVTEQLIRSVESVERRDILMHSVLDYMDDRQMVKFGFKPVSKFVKLIHLIYSVTSNKKYFQSSGSSGTEIERTESISATFTTSDIQSIPCEDSSIDNGQGDISRNNSTLLTSWRSPNVSPRTSSGPGSLYAPSTSPKPHDLDNRLPSELSHMKQQVEDHLSKLSLRHREGWKTSCSRDVRAAFQSGRIVMPVTVNIKQIKNIKYIKRIRNFRQINKIRKIKYINRTKKINKYGPGTKLKIAHAEAVAPGGKIVVHYNQKVTNDDDEYEDISSEDDSDNNV